jgi:isopenicillin-N epimerase
MLPLQLESLGAGYYTGNFHKWLCAPKGAAFLYVRPDLQPSVRPLCISHGATVKRQGRTRFREEFDWAGTDDPTAFLCAPESIRYLGAILPGGFDELREKNRALVLWGRDRICAALGVKPPAPDEMIGSLAAVPLPQNKATPLSYLYADPLRSTLLERHGVEVPIISWPAPPMRLIRVSAQLYNLREDYERLANALKQLLAAGAL